MGRQWYEEPNGAKYLCKENTFNDFCDIATWLLEVRKCIILAYYLNDYHCDRKIHITTVFLHL